MLVHFTPAMCPSFAENERKQTRPNSWAKQVREIERGHWILDFMIYEMKNGEGKV